jgi:hypothetical protein
MADDVLTFTLENIHRTMITLLEEQEKTNDLLANLIILMKEPNAKSHEGNGNSHETK